MPARPLNAVTVGLIAAITIAGFAIRIVHINDSLWLDELHSSWAISGDFSEVAWRASFGNQPPLLYWIAWVFRSVLGESEFALRLPSLMAGVALIVVAWWLVRRLTGSDVAGLVSAALIAIDPQLIYYSTEFRGYGAACLLGVLQVAAFVRLMLGFHVPARANVDGPADSRSEKLSKKELRRKEKAEKRAALETAVEAVPVSWKDRLIFVGLTLLMFYFHYTTILLLFVEVPIAVAVLCFRDRRLHYKPIWLLVDGAIIAAGCLPACLHVLSIGGRKDDWIQMVRAWPLKNDVLAVLAAYAISMVLLALGWVIVRGMFADKSQRPFVPWLRMAFFSLCFLLLFGSIWALTYFQIASLMHLRYLAAGLALPMIAIGLGIGLFRDNRVQAVLAVAVVIAAFVGNHRFNDWFRDAVTQKQVLAQRFENWEGVSQGLSQIRDPKKLSVYLMAGLVEDHRLPPTDKRTEADAAFVEYCGFPLTGIYRLDPKRFDVIPIHSFPNGDPFFDEQQLSALEDGEQIFLVSRSDMPATHAFNELQMRLTKDGYQLNVPAPRRFGNVFVFSAFASKREKSEAPVQVPLKP